MNYRDLTQTIKDYAPAITQNTITRFRQAHDFLAEKFDSSIRSLDNLVREIDFGLRVCGDYVANALYMNQDRFAFSPVSIDRRVIDTKQGYRPEEIYLLMSTKKGDRRNTRPNTPEKFKKRKKEKREKGESGGEPMLKLVADGVWKVIFPGEESED